MTGSTASVVVNISYDDVPYPSYSFAESHPDHLATLATLLGMAPPAVDQCRVLELGCASGGNLIPIAYGLPESRFVGVDLSAHQIDQGQTTAAALGLKNITFQHLDILDVSSDLGQFDYIIAHGVFSWVPRAVQDKLLEICKQNLAPNGVAYVSYNVYPGWHMLDIVRGMMLYHIRGITDPQTRATEARTLLSFLAESTRSENSLYGSFLNMYHRFLSGEQDEANPKHDSALLHDELEMVNDPVYFYQFAERAERQGLQYLAEAVFRATLVTNFPPEVAKTIAKMSKNIVDLEQYVDFLQNRTFRQTLLCHDGIPLRRQIKPQTVRDHYIVSCAQPVSSNPDIHSVSVEKYRSYDEATFSTDHPLSKAAMFCLATVWPQALSFDQLLSAARARLNGKAAASGEHGLGEQERAGDLDVRVLSANLLKAYTYSENLVNLHVHVPTMVSDARERPVASPVARLQAQQGHQITNLYHQRIRADEFDRFLLRCLDGSHDRAALLDTFLAGPVAQGTLTVKQDGKLVEEAKEVERLLADELEQRLSRLARLAVLVG